ncbi:MAG: thermonuclease family protein [Pseudomonadota bacterium]
MKFRTIIVLTIPLIIICQAKTSAAAKSRKYERLNAKPCLISQIKFDDGDSFSCAGEPIRVLGIDTPEIIHKEHGIFKDQEGGREAAAATKKMLGNAKQILIVRDGKDPFGRTLAHVLIDGELLGVKLLKMGLAYENVTHFGDNGLPEFALQVLETAKASPKPDFEEPYKWRKRNQRRP